MNCRYARVAQPGRALGRRPSRRAFKSRPWHKIMPYEAENNNNNILIQVIPLFFRFSMNKGKTKKSKTKKSSAKSTKAKTKRVSKNKKSKNSELFEDTGVIVVDDDLTVDKEKELEERRAFLEEARSQDSSE